ncbi:hypothetical protein MTO96_010074 [Rhipicephalus appendiculatus]
MFVLSVLWVAFGCLRFHVLLMSLVRWRRANTTLKVKPSLRPGSTCRLQSLCALCGKSRGSSPEKMCEQRSSVSRGITWPLPSEASSSWPPSSRAHAIIFVMHWSPMESMASFVSGQVGGNIEYRADGESQLDEASQGPDVAGSQHFSTTGQRAEEQESEKVDLSPRG